MDRQVDTHFESPWTPKEKIIFYTIFCIAGLETLNLAIFLPFHLAKLALLTSLVKDKIIFWIYFDDIAPEEALVHLFNTTRETYPIVNIPYII